MPNDSQGTNYADGILSLGYPYTRPSRNRCGLYVCREALRLVSQLLLLNSEDELRESTIHLDIFTDSNYAFNLLQNSTNVLRWGSYKEFATFRYDGDMPELKANVDIL